MIPIESRTRPDQDWENMIKNRTELDQESIKFQTWDRSRTGENFSNLGLEKDQQVFENLKVSDYPWIPDP